jgi:hypothetical protein
VQPALVQAILGTRLLNGVKLTVSPAGAVEEVNVYHNDVAPIPAAVKALVKEKFPGAHVLNYETEWETDEGPTVEVEVRTEGGRFCELSATPAGVLAYTRCDVSPHELAPPTLEAVQRALPDGQIEAAAFRQSDHGDTLLVEVRVAAQTHRLILSTTGQVVARELKVPATLYLRY